MSIAAMWGADLELRAEGANAPGEAARMRPRLGSLVTCALAVVLLGACDGSPSESETGAVYEVSVETGNGIETFRIRLDASAQIAEAERLLASGERRNVSGALVRGDGGFNSPYPWHLAPETVAFPESTIELCDGSPSEIGRNLDYWINTVKQFCPWGSWISRRVPG